MAIDRADDGDAPARLSERPAADVDRAAPLDAGESAAEHARYRARVESYGAASDVWVQAAPGLEAAWQRHLERYPERERPTPQTKPDGSWEAGETRKLDPEQNAEASKACADIRVEGKEVILPAMQRVEAAAPDRQLAGLEHMLKGEDRLKEKIADYMRAPGVTVREALEMVPDTVRFTLRYPVERYADGVRTDVDRFKEEGFELIKLKNLWSDDQYKGINSQWCRRETGLRFEVQFHTPESLEAKELTHKAYERIRGSASAAERRELEDFQSQVNAIIDTPPGADGIEDLPEKNDV